jgi:hypothetical protein
MSTPSGVFDDFLAIPAAEGDIEGGVSTQSFSDFVQSLGPLFATNGRRWVAESASWWNTG